MKKGKVIPLSLSHKNLNKVFKAGDKVTENDVDNFDLLVKKGYIKPDESAKVKEKKESKNIAPEVKKESDKVKK